MSNQDFLRSALSPIRVVPMTGTSCQHARRTILVVQTAVLVTAVRRRRAHFRDVRTGSRLALVFVLFALAVASDVMIVEMRGLRVSGAFFAVVLAMVLLGPAPAVAIGVGTTLAYAPFIAPPIRARCSPTRSSGRCSRSSAGSWPRRSASTPTRRRSGFCAVVVLVYMATNILNFLLIARRTTGRRPAFSFWSSGKSLYLTMLPSEVATALLTATVAYGYVRLGIGAVALAAVVLVVFQYLVWARVQAYERGEELAKRGRELASLQVGLLSTVMQTLSMRDAMTARHSAAVARYAREVARLLGTRRARAGPDPHRRAAARHRQVHLPRLDPLRRPQADGRGVGDRQAAPGAGRQARPPHRGLRSRRRHHHRPPRARRRQGLPARHRRRGHPARLAHHLGRRHLRRHDLA